MMRRREWTLALAATGCGRGGRRLNVFNWSEYIGESTLAEFEKSTGIRLHYAVYESNEELLAKVFAGNSGWDIAFPSNYFIEPMRANRLLARLNHRRLANLRHLDPMLRNPEWDPGMEYCVPYLWGATGIAYRRELDPPPAAWADLWHPRLRRRITMLDDPADAMGASLLRLGFPLNTNNPAHLTAARDELLAQKPLVRAYLNTEARDQLAAGDLDACQMWATTALFAMDDSSDIRFVYPREGFALYADNAVILRESSRVEMAHEFLEYLLDPKVAAPNAVSANAATANAAARSLLPEAVRTSPVLYPDRTTLGRGQWFRPLSPAAQRLRDRYWTEIKSG